ncbi:MAG: peptidase M20, partial [Gemmatimonadetes bacterium]|nr:peptidase M20 [Gemmatimonadota bacterium]
MPMMRRARVSLAFAVPLALALAWPAAAQRPSVREWSRANEHAILREYVDFLAIPNVASDRENIRRNAAHIVAMMERRGLRPRLLEAADSTAPPSVYGEWTVPGATRTLVLYAHYDGQPTDSTQWTVTHPWRPVLLTARADRGGRP